MVHRYTDSCKFSCTSFFSLQREHGTNDSTGITMQQLIIIPSLFTETIYHSKLSWKMIRTASRIRGLNMAKWLSVSHIDLDIRELYLQSSKTSNTTGKGDSVHVRWYVAYSHNHAWNSWHSLMRFSSLIQNCIKVNAEVHGRTQDGVFCTWGHAAGGGVFVWMLLCECTNETFIVSSIDPSRDGNTIYGKVHCKQNNFEFLPVYWWIICEICKLCNNTHFCFAGRNGRGQDYSIIKLYLFFLPSR